MGRQTSPLIDVLGHQHAFGFRSAHFRNGIQQAAVERPRTQGQVLALSASVVGRRFLPQLRVEPPLKARLPNFRFWHFREVTGRRSGRPFSEVKHEPYCFLLRLAPAIPIFETLARREVG